MFRYYSSLFLCVVMWSFILHRGFSFCYQSVDTELKPYVEEYYAMYQGICPQKAKLSSSMYSIQFVPDNDTWIGVCQPKINGYNLRINKKYWDESNANDRTQLMYHELAHCVISKMHVDDSYNYMNPVQYPIPYKEYIIQVKEDIEEYCNK